jgi:hypothetical protein
MKTVIFLVAISLCIISCGGKRYVLRDSDPMIAFLEAHHPSMKLKRQELAKEIETCKSHLAKLDSLYGDLEQKPAKDFIYERIKSLTVQRAALVNQLAKVDAEVEKSMALEFVNSLEGGGLREASLNPLLEETTFMINQFHQFNQRATEAYDKVETK